MFIRIKKIQQKPYAYLVKNTWTTLGPRQKVAKYLGKVVKFEKSTALSFEAYVFEEYKKELANYLLNVSFKQFVSDLMAVELIAHGFRKEKELLSNKDCVVDLDSADVFSAKDKSPAVFQMNEGFLCATSFRKLQNFKPKKNQFDSEIGYELGERCISAGLDIKKDLFIALYTRATRNRSVI